MVHPACQRRQHKPKRPQQDATPFDLGWQAAAIRWAALERGEAPGWRTGPFQPGTRADADYVRGWRAAIRKFSAESV
jgi:hypothetical protein